MSNSKVKSTVQITSTNHQPLSSRIKPGSVFPRISFVSPPITCHHKPASKIDYPYRIPPPDRNAPNDTEEGQAERREEEEERAGKKRAEKKQQKEEKKIDKEKDKKYKKSGESSKGQNEERHRLLGGSRGR
ncbi:hypothetical protein BofuT4_P082040.1 [Botrytis cinerea T4]|uniref:Uncharacterized protein n=1 Tax=Botryotinia fuckeliana (strain T4) TaxID=999810 RepID=G2YK97_BOTF4|nr:hypothetical protein BofuT4_P082040.1 [Botrytis cinerea T4]